MTTILLKAESKDALYAALEAAGLVTWVEHDGQGQWSPLVFLDDIGPIPKATGNTVKDEFGNDQAEYVPQPGYFANIYDPITDEQKALLPVIDAPKGAMYRTKAE